MKALITGASSGIGSEIAKCLADMGCDLILVARRRDALETLARSLGKKVSVRIISTDLSVRENCFELYGKTSCENVDILVNNAGFGVFGNFAETDLDRELSLIDTNVTAVHILTKLFLKDFVAADKGRILNVASSAAFTVGPLMSAYYASKSYVFRLSQGISEELRRAGSRVSMSVLCPGPVDTEFNDVAGVRFGVPAMKSPDVARIAVDGLLNGKKVIVPGAAIKFGRIAGKLLPDGILARVGYNIQKKKDR